MDEPEQRTDDDRRIALDARDWIVRLTSGHVSDNDIERFKHWRDSAREHHDAFERERVFWRQLQVLESASDGTTPMRVPGVAARRPVNRRGFLIGTGAAAAGIAALALPGMEQWWRTDFSTGVGEQAEFVLPDGSVAMLNTDSAISVDFGQNLRLVELLAGEAEFKVMQSPEALFRVAALGGNSDAIGTTFSVRIVDDLATVTVIEGHVRVSGPTTPTDIDMTSPGRVDLTVGEQTSYGVGEQPQLARQVDTETELAWRTGRIIFEGRPFASAIAELGRYVPERIVLGPGVASQIPVTAIFSTGEALAAVQALARTQGLKARRIPGVVVFVS